MKYLKLFENKDIEEITEEEYKSNFEKREKLPNKIFNKIYDFFVENIKDYYIEDDYDNKDYYDNNPIYKITNSSENKLLAKYNFNITLHYSRIIHFYINDDYFYISIKYYIINSLKKEENFKCDQLNDFLKFIKQKLLK